MDPAAPFVVDPPPPGCPTEVDATLEEAPDPLGCVGVVEGPGDCSEILDGPESALDPPLLELLPPAELAVVVALPKGFEVGVDSAVVLAVIL